MSPATSGSGPTPFLPGSIEATGSAGTDSLRVANDPVSAPMAYATALAFVAAPGGLLRKGTAGKDTLTGGVGADTLSGGAGDDRLDGGAGADRLIGGNGNDLLVGGTEVDWLNGGAGADRLLGGDGNDILVGGADADRLEGGAGDDVLRGGTGDDRLITGAGRDRVVFGVSDGADAVADFAPGSDRVQLVGVSTEQVAATVKTIGGVSGLELRLPQGETLFLEGLGAVTAKQLGLRGSFLPDTPPAPEPDPVSDRPGPSPSPMPTGAIRVTMDDNLQAMINAAPTGATFWLEAGVHRLESVMPKNGQHFVGAEGAIMNGAKLLTSFTKEGQDWVAIGQTQQGQRNAEGYAEPGMPRASHPDAFYIDNVPLQHVGSRAELGPGKYYFDYAADKIYFRDAPTGHTVEAAVSPFAFGGSASNVTIENLVVEKYAAPIQFGAIFAMPGTNWLVQDNEVRLNYGVGIVVGEGGKILNNYVHDNGQMGLGGTGNDILVQGNEIASNGFWSGYDVLWEGGGTKFAITEDLIVRDNYSHDNHGFGLWTDIDNVGALYEGNRVDNNSLGGIMHEISYDAVIRNNTFAGNGEPGSPWLSGAAIRLQNSQHVQVYGNTIDMTAGGNGIALIQDERGTGAHGEYLTQYNSIHDNVLISRDAQGASGGFAGYEEEVMLAAHNTFDYNQYGVTSTTDDHWAWGDYYGWDDFRAASGQESHGSVFLV